MLFSELIASEDYKPRPNARSGDKNKVIQRLTQRAYNAIEERVIKGDIDLLSDRHYVTLSELVDAAGGTFKGRDKTVEDFNLDMDSEKTQAALNDFFSGARSYGKPKTSSGKSTGRNPKLDNKRENAKEALRILIATNDSMSKKDILTAVEYFKRSFNAYAKEVRPLQGFTNLPPLDMKTVKVMMPDE